MESSFWELFTGKKGQNQGHRKSQDYLKLLTNTGKPQQGWMPQGATPGPHACWARSLPTEPHL